MEVRLGHLKKYVPFMDYILTTEYKHKDKFEKMRQWILDNKKFAKGYSEKIEKSIIVTYKDFCKQKDFPKDLHKIFTVDLCSDDEIEEVATKTVAETVTIISDNENDDGDVEIIAVSTSNVVPKRSMNRDHNNLESGNEEILNRINTALYEAPVRINAANRLNVPSTTNPFSEAHHHSIATNPFNETPQTLTHTSDESKSPDNTAINDFSIYRRRKDFPEIIPENINDENVATEKLHNNNNNGTPKSKKKKKKHKKEKRHRHNKHKTPKDKYIVVDKIVLSSSTDEEDICNEHVPNNVSRNLKNAEPQSTTLDMIGYLDEPDLLKMKSKIIAEIETETRPILSEPERNEKEKESECGSTSTGVGENVQSNCLNESELLQMKEKLMKQIGLDQSTSELFKDLDFSFTDKPANQEKQNKGSDKNEPTSLNQIAEPIRVLDKIPIVNSTSHPIPVLDHSTLRNMATIETLHQPNRNTYQQIRTVRSQYRPLLPLPHPFPMRHPNNQFIGSHQYMPNINTSFTTPCPAPFTNPPLPVPPPLQLVPPINPTPQFAVPTVPLRIPDMSLPQNQPVAAQCHGSSNVFPSQPFPTHRSSSNLISIPRSTITIGGQQLQQPPLPPTNQPNQLSPPVNFALNVSSTSAIPQSNSLPTSTISMTASTQTSYAHTVTSTSKDPRLRKIIEEGSYGHNRKHPSQTTQALSSPQPVTTIHNWNQLDSTASSTSTSDKGTTKSQTTYGEYVQRKEEQKRIEKQRKLQEHQRLERAAKEVEEIELRRETENIKQILNTRRDDIIALMKDLDAKKQQNEKITSDSSIQSPLPLFDKEHHDKDKIVPNITARRKSCTVKNRTLKELECTVKGFNTMQDYLSTNGDGKRRSSISARKAIAFMLIPPSEAEDQNKTVSPRKRRRLSSVNTDAEMSQINRKNYIDDGKGNTTERKDQDLPKMKRCRVVLKRMSYEEIARHSKKRAQNDTKVDTTMQPTSKESSFLKTSFLSSSSKPTNEVKRKPQEKMYATKRSSASIEMKNIDCQMTERNCDKCVLCNSRSSNLTNHFIRIHKKESYLSRLTWEELDDLQMKVPFAEELTSPSKSKSSGAGKVVQRFRVECPFCPEGQREVIDTFANLRRHYSTHTGEYAYQCKGCGIHKPYRKDIMNHRKRTKCIEAGVQTLYQYPSHLMVIYMYVCNICNFVQLNEENVFKHLREQHGKVQKDPKYVKEYTLAAIKDEPIERVRLGTIPSSQNFMDQAIFDQEDNENVVVGNEPLLDESSPNIKPEPMDDENEFLWDTSRKITTSMEQATSNTPLSEPKIDGTNEAECLQTTALDIKPELDALLHSIFETSKATLVKLTSGQENESTALQPPVLENKPDPEKLTLEAVKALLRKYSANTGIRPDLLYQCSDPECRGFFSNFKLWSSHMTTRHNAIVSICPHCVKKKGAGASEGMELPIAEFEPHFRDHSLRLYLCFHCDTRCVDEQQLREHAQHAHADIVETRIERIPFNFTYAYHVLVDKDVLPTRLDFLMQLCNILRERIQRMEAQAEDSEYVISQWSVPKTAAWLDELNIPTFSSIASNPKCMLSSCQMTFSDPSSLLDHLKTQHNSHKGYLFACMLCGNSGPSKTLVTLVKHNFMHSENIFICCLCSYMTYDRRLLSKHICSEHDKRDVAVLRLHRSETAVKFTIEFIFASGSKTFTTTRVCFCGCGTNDLQVDTYVSHLRREHMLKLRYFCEYCDERFPQLQLSDEHFRMKHSEPGKVSKVRCQLACSNDRQVKIVCVQPLQIQLSDESYDYNRSYTESPRKSVNIAKTVIRKESGDEDGDEPIIMEEDEIIAEKEAKVANKIRNTARSDINCTSIWKLM